ncbi:MAG: glutamate--tRNA ligase, partial [Bacilli bacterium]|nr:glutamate--tRNA ligase [Bacilli bacterium]
LPDAVVNYLVLLGWSPETNQEVYTMDELVKAFDANRISKSPSSYDIKKLRWFNAKYIKNLSNEDYLKFVRPFLKYDVSDKSEEWVNKLLLIYKDHLSYGNEINELVGIFFNDEINISEENQEFLNSDENIPVVINAYKEEISNLTDWNVEVIAEVINKVKEKTGIKGKLLYMPIRIKISGVEHGPELPDEIYLIGKEKVIDRLK